MGIRSSSLEMAKPAIDEVLLENDAEFDPAVTLEDEAMAL